MMAELYPPRRRFHDQGAGIPAMAGRRFSYLDLRKTKVREDRAPFVRRVHVRHSISLCPGAGNVAPQQEIRQRNYPDDGLTPGNFQYGEAATSAKTSSPPALSTRFISDNIWGTSM